MQIVFKLLLSFVVTSHASAAVWYDCKTASGQPPQLSLEIKEGAWARLTIGNSKIGYRPCVIRISNLENDLIKYENAMNDYSAQARIRECNEAYKDFGGDFGWLKIHKTMALPNTAPALGHAVIRSGKVSSPYACTRVR